MISDALKSHLESVTNHPITNITSVSGGDISEAYLVESNNIYFLKCHSSPNALTMFEAEKKSLETIAQTKVISTPKIFDFGEIDKVAFLVMEYIPTINPNSYEMKLFAEQLAKMHLCTSDNFGLSSDNFIGSLHQSNTLRNEWTDFYVQERIKPQLKFALSKQLLSAKELPSENALYRTCDSLFQNVIPSLVHGDLWSGNYIISEEGQPYLIDPAVYYGHHEVDIAMSLLFGNFGDTFYTAYHNIIPQDDGFEDRIKFYQLYYLLVHLNLFGTSYRASVLRILRTYF